MTRRKIASGNGLRFPTLPCLEPIAEMELRWGPWPGGMPSCFLTPGDRQRGRAAMAALQGLRDLAPARSGEEARDGFYTWRDALRSGDADGKGREMALFFIADSNDLLSRWLEWRSPFDRESEQREAAELAARRTIA